MRQTTFVYKNAAGKWVPGFASRQSAIDAALDAGLTQFETASVTTEPPAYFVRFLAPVALQKMIDGLRDGEQSGHVVDSWTCPCMNGLAVTLRFHCRAGAWYVHMRPVPRPDRLRAHRRQRRMNRMPAAMTLRRRPVEHEFGTFRHWMGYTRFLTRQFANDQSAIPIKDHCIAATSPDRQGGFRYRLQS